MKVDDGDLISSGVATAIRLRAFVDSGRVHRVRGEDIRRRWRAGEEVDKAGTLGEADSVDAKRVNV
jgi:hypothetical protein